MKQVTVHAQLRTKERAGVKGKKISESAIKAWEKGTSYDEVTNSRIKRYIRNITLRSKDEDREVRLYGGYVYIFNKKGVLITIFPLPEEIVQEKNRKIRNKIRNRYRMEERECQL